MRIIDADAVEAALDFPSLVDTIELAFQANITAPVRHHHNIQRAPSADATLLLMPAWTHSAAQNVTPGTAPLDSNGTSYIGIKIIAVVPDNADRQLPAVQGTYLLMSAVTGQTLAMIDAPRLTVLRTAAASALASHYLSREASSKLLMVGAGALAPYLIRAHASVRPITDVAIWNRTSERALECAAEAGSRGLNVEVVDDLEAAVRQADIISVATLSTEPLIKGAWLQSGQHLDTVGAFRPDMRETDDAVVQRASVFVDTLEGGLNEAGDIVQPLRAGVISKDAIKGDLFDLTAGRIKGRKSVAEITYFKSVGASLEDLAAAIAVYENTDEPEISAKDSGFISLFALQG